MDVFHLSGKTPTRNDRLMNSIIGVMRTSIISLSSFVGILSNSHDLVASFLNIFGYFVFCNWIGTIKFRGISASRLV